VATLRSDHLVGAEDKRLRKTDSEHICCLEIENQFEFCWLLDRQIGGFCALQYFVGVGHCATTSMRGVGPTLAFTLIALLPELGQMSRKQIAALVGTCALRLRQWQAQRTSLHLWRPHAGP